ncbi:hypothetical protein [Pseudorhodoplanes sp.]|uniref:hypothetical protein n=1 Tax=Pseudorhodoplanes sp. TaxID=1934341 RepID=UPI002BE52EDE|nr:hypothetical protein [Pseudorhodoplanes sp.]HWV53044.1 hypothetical protein [Pseudorhodoplanes sp.]
MNRKILLTLLAAAGAIAAVSALAPTSHTQTITSKTDLRYDYQGIRQVNRHVFDGCLSEPVECGLVVW